MIQSFRQDTIQMAVVIPDPAYGFSDTLDVGGLFIEVTGTYVDTGGVFHDAAYRDFISPIT